MSHSGSDRFRHSLSYLFMFLLFVFSSATTRSQPEIEIVGGPLVEFGITLEGRSVTKSLILKNIGNDTLRISDIETDCGCTVPNISSKIIAPHDSILLTIRFDTQGYSGNVKQNIRLLSNVPGRPKFEVSVLITVDSLIKISKSTLKFLKVKLGTTSTQTVNIINISSRDSVYLITPQSSNPQISCTLADTILLPLHETTLTVNLNSKNPGLLFETLELKTDTVWGLLFKIHCYARVTK